MNESLAARQEALQRQNQELNQQVEAIEQRRQQQLSSTSRPSSSTSLHGSRAALPQAELVSPGKSDPGLNDDGVDQLAEAKTNLEIELSASIDSLSPQNLKEARRQLAKSESMEQVEAGTRIRSAERSQQRKQQKKDETSPQSEPHSKKKGRSSPSTDDPIRGSTPEGLGLEATVRYQKARLRVLQDEADAAIAQAQQLQTAQNSLKTEIDTLKAENATLNKKAQQSQQLLEKQRELSAAQEAKQRILEGQLSAAEARAEETQRAEKMTSQQFRSKDVRLNRALEELEKAKAQLQEEKRSHGEQMVTKAEYDQVVRDSKKLDKQKGELLAAFKKQMKLIDLLKRQRIHMEAAKMLSFTEAEFSKTLELG